MGILVSQISLKEGVNLYFCLPVDNELLQSLWELMTQIIKADYAYLNMKSD